MADLLPRCFLLTMNDWTPERRAEILARIHKPEPLYTVARLAEHYNVSRQTIYNWEKSGRLPERRTIQGRQLWTATDLKTFRGYMQ